MIAHWGVRALHARVFRLHRSILEPPRTSDETIVVVSRGLEFTRCEEPSPVLLVTEFRDLSFQLERAT